MSEPLFPDAANFSVDLDTAAVEQRIPHREPLRLVDALTALDLIGMRAAGTRAVDPADPVFAGHFPDQPIYPGIFQIEAIGQLGLCLAWELAQLEGETDIDPRVVRVSDARFFAPVSPGDCMSIESKIIDLDSLLGRIIGQVWVGETLCSSAVMEVYFA